MAGSPAVKPYRWLAQYYDEIFSPLRSPIGAARDQILSEIWPRVKTACDLGCGTGTTALALARKGIKTYAVDRSPEMCRLTRQKAQRAGLPLRVVRGDMRDFRLPEPVDLITCEGDALNHVARHADLGKVANAVRRALRPGGYFFFDVNNAEGFEQYWSGTIWFERPNIVVVMRNGHNRRVDHAWSDIECFIRDGRGWRRRHDRVDEVCWDSGRVRRTFREAGFDRPRAWDEAPFFRGNPIIGPGCRTFYLAHKKLLPG